MTKLTKRLCAAFAAGMALVSFTAFADIAIRPGYPLNWFALDPREVAMLPPYCKYTQIYRSQVTGGGVKAQIDRWTAIMGPSFHAMHHYCHGLLKTNRALLLATDEKTKEFYLDSSIQEFDFVINRVPPNFIMLPEILTKKGENQIRVGRDGLGIETLQKAMALKPDYWPPYTALADYYKDHGHPAEARTVLEKALQFSPDAEAVKRRLAALGEARAMR